MSQLLTNTLKGKVRDAYVLLFDWLAILAKSPVRHVNMIYFSYKCSNLLPKLDLDAMNYAITT